MQQTENFQKPSLAFVCKEDWNAMSACEKGRFCGSCQKTVVDFTKKSDTEIREMLLNRKGKVCGRFYAKQLVPPVQWKFSFSRMFGPLLLLFGFGCQDNIRPDEFITGEIIEDISDAQPAQPPKPPIPIDIFNKSNHSKVPVLTPNENQN